MADYEDQRAENIRRNRELLVSLGLASPPSFMQPKPKAKRKPAQSKKRQAPSESANADENDEERPKKAAKAVGDGDATEGVRRSSRNKGKTLNYNEDGQSSAAAARALPRVISASAQRAMDSAPRDAMKRTHDPKTYGAIPGIPVGTWWETRQACSVDAVHAPWVAGISAGPKGAYSVALSGGYEDDVDLGNAFTFTGSGGRDLKGTKAQPKNLRTAPQSCDQSFENAYNKALQKSCETKKPVRVIRGYKLHSEYAPAEGYRYDGLYTVEQAWMEKGLNKHGFLVCKFALKRMPGQAPLQYGDDEQEEDAETRDSSAPVSDEEGVKSESTAPTDAPMDEEDAKSDTGSAAKSEKSEEDEEPVEA